MMSQRRELLVQAVQHFWQVRGEAAERGARRDRGQRGAVTGGTQLDGILTMVENEILRVLPEGSVEIRRGRRAPVVPGYFRPEKEWDLVVLIGEQLGALVELKSHVGPSFGNNFNNRAEEALGSADDLWTAYREGAFGMQSAPWAGYFLLLEDTEASRKVVSVSEPIFKVFDEFREASYADRYELLLRRMMRERRYSATCLVMTTNPQEDYFKVTEPAPDMTYTRWINSLLAHLQGFVLEDV